MLIMLYPKITKENNSFIDGYVHCDKCGWHKETGNGFRQTHIEFCPNCEPNCNKRMQTQLTITKGNYDNTYRGQFHYFVIKNGIHVLYKEVGQRYQVSAERRLR